MAKLSFKKPHFGIVIGEIIALVVWLFFGDRVVDVLNGIVGRDNLLNTTVNEATNVYTNTGGCTNGTVFADAFEIIGVGYDCAEHVAGNDINLVANHNNGLLGIVALILSVMVLMNFVQYK